MDEWKICSEWTNKINEALHDHVNSALCIKYPDFQIVAEHMFYLGPDSTRDLNQMRIYIGVTDDEMDSNEYNFNLELHGGYGIVAIPNSIYRAMYYNPSVMSNFELAMGDALDGIVNKSLHWSGDCGIVKELKTYIAMHSNEIKE